MRIAIFISTFYSTDVTFPTNEKPNKFATQIVDQFTNLLSLFENTERNEHK